MSGLRFTIFLLILPATVILGQDPYIDSLVSLLPGTKDTARIDLLNKIVEEEMYYDPPSALKYAEEAYRMADSLKDERRMMLTSSNLGIINIEKGNYLLARDFYSKALEIATRNRDSVNIAKAYGNLGNTYMREVKEREALDYFSKALGIFEAIGHRQGIALSHGTIANLYILLEEYEKALEHAQTSEKIFEELGNKGGMATNAMNQGVIYKSIGVYPKALTCFTRAHQIFRELQYPKGIAQCLGNIGDTYIKMSEYQNAINELGRAIEIFREIDTKDEELLCLENLGQAYDSLGRYDMALVYYTDAISLAEELKSFSFLETTNWHAYHICKKTGNITKALSYLEAYCMYHDSLYNKQKQDKLTELLTQFETERKEKEIVILKKDQKLQQLELEKNNDRMKRQMTIIYVSVAGFILILLFSVVLARQYRQKKRANRILEQRNEEVMQQKEEIESQRDEIEAQRNEVEKQKNIAVAQRDEIEKQQKDITDSLEYAGKMQTALMPDTEEFTEVLPVSFCMFLPRDIVSGDFFWISHIDNKSVVAAADCTGHGVPGAFVSIIGINLLNEIVNEKKMREPDKILNRLRAGVIEAFEHSYSRSDRKDGMDIALCVFDFQNLSMQFAGAHNHLYYIRNNELFVIKADLMPVGASPKEDIPFTCHQLALEKGDMIYIFSDGFVDQFGGAHNHKFKSRNFKELLLKIHNQPEDKQKELLLKEFHDWRGKHEQVDDVLVIGVRV